MLLLWIKVDSYIPIILPNLNPICHLLALGAHHILHVGRIRDKTWNATYINSANVSHTKQFILTMLHRLSFSLWPNFTSRNS
jgi:hypothetical protein